MNRASVYISLRDYTRHIQKDSDFKSIYNFKVKVPIAIKDVLYCEFYCDDIKEVKKYFEEIGIEIIKK